MGSRLRRDALRSGISERNWSLIVFLNQATGVLVIVHCDDFAFSGARGELEHKNLTMAEWYDSGVLARVQVNLYFHIQLGECKGHASFVFTVFPCFP